MKNGNILLGTLLVLSIALNGYLLSRANNSAPTNEVEQKKKITSIQFDDTFHDFGELKQATQTKYNFVFKNTGTEPLIIYNAVGSCGCTVSDFPRKVIPPNEKSEIEVVYNTLNKKGFQRQTITVSSNTKPTQTVLTIKAMVRE